MPDQSNLTSRLELVKVSGKNCPDAVQMSPGRSLGSVEPNAILVFTTAIAISVDKFVLSKWTGAGAAALR